MFIDCLLWAPEIQMLFGLLGLLWYGTHYSSIIFLERSLKLLVSFCSVPSFSLLQRNNENSYVSSFGKKEGWNEKTGDNKSSTLSSNNLVPFPRSGNEVVSLQSNKEEAKTTCFSGPSNLVQHLLYWSATWCFLSAAQVWLVPLNGVQFSGVFIRDYWTQSISLALMVFALLYLLISAQWLIQAKSIHLEYSLLVLLAVFGQHLLCMSTDLMSLYISLELQSFCFVILCSLNYQSLYSIEAGMKYFLLSAFSSGLFLLGISFIYWTTGLTNCTNINEFLQTTDLKENIIFLVGVWLVSLTLLWKLAAAPLHLWAADVYQGAWSSVTLLLSTLPKLAILSFWLHQWHPIWSNTFGEIMIWFSGLSMLVGAIGAMGQVHIKRLMAFSSIGHMGILLMPLCTIEGSSSALLSHLFIYFCTSLITWGLIMWPFVRQSAFLIPSLPSPVAFSSSVAMNGNAFPFSQSGGKQAINHLILSSTDSYQEKQIVNQKHSSKGKIFNSIPFVSYATQLSNSSVVTQQIGTPQYLWDFSLLWKTNQMGAWSWTIAMMSLAGLPPVAGFLGKLGVFWWSLNAHQYSLLAIALLSTLISTVYYLRLIRIMYIDKPNQWSHFHQLSDIPAYLISISLIFLLSMLWYSSPLVLVTHLISLS